jgi:hypothetical protein
MNAWLSVDREKIAGQPACVDPWLVKQLASTRDGDDEAARCISGSCLTLALAAAEQAHAAEPGIPLADFVEEANAALKESVSTFDGASAAEFRSFVSKAISQRFMLVTSPP